MSNRGKQGGVERPPQINAPAAGRIDRSAQFQRSGLGRERAGTYLLQATGVKTKSTAIPESLEQLIYSVGEKICKDNADSALQIKDKLIEFEAHAHSVIDKLPGFELEPRHGQLPGRYGGLLLPYTTAIVEFMTEFVGSGDIFLVASDLAKRSAKAAKAFLEGIRKGLVSSLDESEQTRIAAKILYTRIDCPLFSVAFRTGVTWGILKQLGESVVAFFKLIINFEESMNALTGLIEAVLQDDRVAFNIGFATGAAIPNELKSAIDSYSGVKLAFELGRIAGPILLEAFLAVCAGYAVIMKISARTARIVDKLKDATELVKNGDKYRATVASTVNAHAKLWNLDNAQQRGRSIQDVLATTDYKDWQDLDKLEYFKKGEWKQKNSDNFPAYDFQKGTAFAQLKTYQMLTTKGARTLGWKQDALKAIESMFNWKGAGIKVDGKPISERILDIRLPPGALSGPHKDWLLQHLNEIKAIGVGRDVKVIWLEFP